MYFAQKPWEFYQTPESKISTLFAKEIHSAKSRKPLYVRFQRKDNPHFDQREKEVCF